MFEIDPSTVPKFVLDILVAGGGASAVVFLFLKSVGGAILSRQIGKLEENQKFKLNLEFDRISKLNQKEFEILPQLWEYIVRIRQLIGFYIDETRYLKIDLDKCSEEEFAHFLESLPFPEHLKERLRQAQNRNQEYVNVQEIDGSEIVRIEFTAFDLLYKLNKIFLTSALKDNIGAVVRYYFETLTMFNLAKQQEGAPKPSFEKFETETAPMLDVIGDLIKTRLMFEEKAR